MSENLLCTLPTSLVAVILAKYLLLKHVVMLDSACCSHMSRLGLFEAYRFPGCVVSPSLESHEGEFVNNLINWLVHRRVHVSKVQITDGLDVSRFRDLLGISGPTIKAANFISCESNEQFASVLANFIPYAAQLEQVGFVDSTFPSNV